MKTVNGCKDVSVMSPQDRTAKTYKFTLFVYNCNFLVLLSPTVCSQNINKQIVNIAEENLTDFTIIKELFKKAISKSSFMFIGTPCMINTTFNKGRERRHYIKYLMLLQSK